MAGGEGTRLRPMTANQPKPMLPVVKGERRTKFEMLAYTLMLLPLTIMPALFGALGLFFKTPEGSSEMNLYKQYDALLRWIAGSARRVVVARWSSRSARWTTSSRGSGSG